MLILNSILNMNKYRLRVNIIFIIFTLFIIPFVPISAMKCTYPPKNIAIDPSKECIDKKERKTLDSIRYFSSGGINIEAYIKFDKGKKEIANSSKIFLKKIADKLKDLEYDIFEKSGANEYTIFIDIIGHTDDVGDNEANMILSQNRAISVYNFLIDYGFSPEKMRYRGLGEENPKYSNKDYWGRWHNRRVDLKITKRLVEEFSM